MHCEVPQVSNEVGLQETETPVTAGGGAVLKVMAAVPDLVLSVMLVAVSVTVAAALIEAGAV